jgi:hypothetical protein
LKDGYNASKMLSHECILINDTHDQISRGAISNGNWQHMI